MYTLDVYMYMYLYLTTSRVVIVFAWGDPGRSPLEIAIKVYTTVKPLIVDPLRKGHNMKDLSTRDTA